MTTEVQIEASAEQFCATPLELRSGLGERIEYRGRSWVAGPEQEILRATTTHQGGQRITVTREHLEEMAANATHWPLIPIDFDHKSGKGPDGIAGGVVLPHTLRVDGDRLLGQLAYSDETAADVRAGKWLGVSPRFTLSAESKKTGEKVGAMLLALALTNTPQLDEIQVVSEFASNHFGTQSRNGTNSLDTRTETVQPTAQTEIQTMADKKTDAEVKTEFAGLAALKKFMGMEDEEDEDKVYTAALKALKAGKAEMSADMAKVTELTAERDALADRAAKAEAQVAELSATATDAAKRNVELAGEVKELSAGLAKVNAERLAERQIAEVREFCAANTLGKDREARLLSARRMVDAVDAKHREDAVATYEALKTEFAAVALSKRPAGAKASEAETVKEWTALVEEKLAAGLSPQDANAALLATDEGKRAFAKYTDKGLIASA